ncbi:hypothetical protein MSG28_004931 [Choristoneura fumiferana]|uniref:Uncharacterized protein n=1 Tax=Choristoneura fumiferana TaxID=7141 RepID=A0ACC0JP45_CHOFU|nr:hypothetical protein MSG28_004931 [Choristoneura fumiferana]
MTHMLSLGGVRSGGCGRPTGRARRRPACGCARGSWRRTGTRSRRQTNIESCYPNPCLHGARCASDDTKNFCQCTGRGVHVRMRARLARPALRGARAALRGAPLQQPRRLHRAGRRVSLPVQSLVEGEEASSFIVSVPVQSAIPRGSGRVQSLVEGEEVSSFMVSVPVQSLVEGEEVSSFMVSVPVQSLVEGEEFN